MEEYVFDDALTGCAVTLQATGSAAHVREAAAPLEPCATLFFPGCSLINYGLPLVKSVYDLLAEAGQAEGVSLLCCGKILSFENDGKAVRTAFEGHLRDHVAAAGVRRIVAACPNCVAALRSAFKKDERTAGIEVVALPTVLADMGYKVDVETAVAMAQQEIPFFRQLAAMEAEETEGAACEGAEDAAETAVPDEDVRFAPHDSCPDRATGEFADGLRHLMPEKLVVEAAHNRANSFCCGSLVRAAGKFEKADEQARQHGEEAVEVGADAIVTACVSCAFQLTMAQHRVPVFHYLELLYNWRINWNSASSYMKLRFLFDDTLAPEADGSRTFVGLGPSLLPEKKEG